MSKKDMIAEILSDAGDMYAGYAPKEVAADWIDHGFAPAEVEAWVGIGCWDAATADIWRSNGLSPEQVLSAEEDAQADGDYYEDLIYAACNNDIDKMSFIAAAE